MHALCWKNTFYVSDVCVIFRKDVSLVSWNTKKLFLLLFCIAHTGWNKSEVEAKRYTEQLRTVLSIQNVYLYICLSTPTYRFSYWGEGETHVTEWALFVWYGGCFSGL